MARTGRQLYLLAAGLCLGKHVYGNQTAPGFIASGLSGATAASRYVGATSGGAPTGSGAFLVGDFVIDQTGAIWIYTRAGNPGTWTKGSNLTLDFSARDIQPTGAVAATGSTGKAADAGHVHFSSGMFLCTPTTHAPSTVTQSARRPVPWP
jgi:hypothetical protein